MVRRSRVGSSPRPMRMPAVMWASISAALIFPHCGCVSGVRGSTRRRISRRGCGSQSDFIRLSYARASAADCSPAEMSLDVEREEHILQLRAGADVVDHEVPVRPRLAHVTDDADV